MITLYSKDGLTAKAEIHKFTYTGTFMGTCFLSATISSPCPINFADGDYCVYRGETFILSYDPAKEKQAKRNTHGEAFIYDNIKFNSLADELTRIEFNDIVLHDNGISYTSLPNFSFYAKSVKDLADRIQANLDREYKGSNAWTVTVSPEFDSPQKNISVNGLKVSEALQLANSEFGANYIIRGRTITIGTEGISVGKVFGYGKGNGLYDIQQVTNQDAAIITRLKAYGSNRNLPYRYYNKLKDSNGNPYISEALYIPHLMLPEFPKVENNPSKIYIDSDNITKYGVREGSVYFDSEDNEIYPSIEGMTAQQLAEDGISVSLPAGDNGILNELLDAENPKDDGKLPEKDKDPIKGQFTIYLKDLGFDLSEKGSDGKYKYASTETMQISMKSGACVGRVFDVVENGITKDKSLGYTRFKVVCNRFTDSSINVAFPNSSNEIKTGDKFVILGIEMPDVYIRSASMRLLEAAKEYLSQNDSTKYTYTPKIDEIFMANNPEIGYSIKEGDIFNFADTDLDIDASVIIQTLKITEGESLIPSYEVSLSNDRISNSIEKMQNAINTLASNFTGVTIGQVKSLIQSVGSRYFLSRLVDDSASGNLNLTQNVSILKDLLVKKNIISEKSVISNQFGNDSFTSGQFGSGFRAWIESNGQSYAEIDNLLVRREMLVNVLSIAEIKSVGGQILLSLANMYCKTVIDKGSTWKCAFDNDNGKIPNQFALNDQVICRKFTGENVKYYWALVTAVGDNYIELSKTDKDGLGIPSVEDEIIQFGNRTNPNRQSAIMLSAYGSDAPSIKQYAGVNSYDLTGKEVTVISPKGNKFEGSFTIKTNGTTAPVYKDRSEFVNGTTYFLNDRVSYLGSYWVCIVESTITTPSETSVTWRKDTAGQIDIDKAANKVRTDYKAEVKVLDDKIASKVSQAVFDDLGNRVSQTESKIDQQADRITSIVEKVDDIKIGGKNLIFDSSFENGQGNSAPVNQGVVTRTTGSYVGNYCMKTVIGNVTSESGYSYHSLPVTKDKVYAISVYLKAESSGVLDLRIVNAKWTSTPYRKKINVTTSWERFDLIFTATETNTNRFIVLGKNITFYVDCIQLEEGNKVTPWKEQEVVNRTYYQDAVPSVPSGGHKVGDLWYMKSLVDSSGNVNLDKDKNIYQLQHRWDGKIWERINWSVSRSKITQTENSITSLVENTESLSSRINQTADQIQLAVSEIKIGGKNLVDNSQAIQEIGGNGVDNHEDIRYTDLTVDLVEGEEYTFQCKTDGIWGNKNDTVEAFLMKDKIVSPGNFVPMETNPCTFIAPKTGRYWIRIDSNKGSVKHSFWEFQIEKGNKATDWGLSQNDINKAIINEVASSLTIDKNKISLASKTIEINGTTIAKAIAMEDLVVQSDKGLSTLKVKKDGTFYAKGSKKNFDIDGKEDIDTSLTIDSNEQSIKLTSLDTVFTSKEDILGTKCISTTLISGEKGSISISGSNEMNSHAFTKISNHGIYTNTAGCNVASITSGIVCKAAIVGIGISKFKQNERGDAFVAGVYGRTENEGSAPGYGGYFDTLRANGFVMSMIDISGPTDKYTSLTRDTSFVLGNSSVCQTVYLPSDAYKGTVIWLKQWWTGYMRVRPSDTQQLFDDSSKNDYIDVGEGWTAMCVFIGNWGGRGGRVGRGSSGTKYGTWMISKFKF